MISVEVRQNSLRNVHVIVKKSEELANSIIDAIFLLCGREILTELANRMAIYFRDINEEIRGFPVYTGRYFALKFGGLFKNAKIGGMSYDISLIPPFGEMYNQGKVIPLEKRREIISQNWERSPAYIQMRRMKTGISGNMLLIKYKVPNAYELGIPYANKVENTGWRKTRPYNIKEVLISLRAKVFAKESLSRLIMEKAKGEIRIGHK